MEKYGTDLSELPIGDDQIIEIRDIVGLEKYASMTLPSNRQEAEELIERLRGEK